jgi:hypothetical protein
MKTKKRDSDALAFLNHMKVLAKNDLNVNVKKQAKIFGCSDHLFWVAKKIGLYDKAFKRKIDLSHLKAIRIIENFEHEKSRVDSEQV